jgi:hypothetical protein
LTCTPNLNTHKQKEKKRKDKKEKEAPKSRASIYKDLLARVHIHLMAAYSIVASLPSPGALQVVSAPGPVAPDCPGSWRAALCNSRERHRQKNKFLFFSFLF